MPGSQLPLREPTTLSSAEVSAAPERGINLRAPPGKNVPRKLKA